MLDRGGNFYIWCITCTGSILLHRTLVDKYFFVILISQGWSKRRGAIKKPEEVKPGRHDLSPQGYAESCRGENLIGIQGNCIEVLRLDLEDL